MMRKRQRKIRKTCPKNDTLRFSYAARKKHKKFIETYDIHYIHKKHQKHNKCKCNEDETLGFFIQCKGCTHIYIYMLRKSTVLFIQPKAFNLQQWTVLVCVPIVYTSRRKKFCSVDCPNHSDRSIFLPKASTNLCKSFVTSASLPSSSSAVLRTRS